MLFAVTRRRRITLSGITGRGRIPGRRIRPRLGFSGWRRHGSSGAPAIADKLAVVVADISNAMRYIERRQILPASIGSPAERVHRAALHSEIPAPLLIGTRRQPLPVSPKDQPGLRGV